MHNSDDEFIIPVPINSKYSEPGTGLALTEMPSLVNLNCHGSSEYAVEERKIIKE
jgi:hypothetical protein